MLEGNLRDFLGSRGCGLRITETEGFGLCCLFMQVSTHRTGLHLTGITFAKSSSCCFTAWHGVRGLLRCRDPWALEFNELDSLEMLHSPESRAPTGIRSRFESPVVGYESKGSGDSVTRGDYQLALRSAVKELYRKIPR